MGEADVVERETPAEGSAGMAPTFEERVAQVDRPLRQALVAALGVQRGGDAHAAALSWAWEHQVRFAGLTSPVAYLAKVGRSAVRDRRKDLPVTFAAPVVVDGVPEFEPRLGDAVAALPERQRVAVFLVVGCGWPAAEVGRLLEISESTVRAHVERGLASLRRALGVTEEHDDEVAR